MVDSYGEMVDKSLPVNYTVGSVVRGKVVQISEEGIFVDIGTKTEARLDYSKVVPEDIPEINSGSEIEAKIIGYKDGVFFLSKKALDYERGWSQLEKDYKAQKTINVRLGRKVANGYMADAYRVASGFIHEKNFSKEPAIGDFVEVVIVELDSRKKKVVFTRKPLIIAEKKKKIDQEYEGIQVGMEVEGRVEKLSAFGAFVKITDHVVGLLHISEMSHDHIKAPASVCKVGDKFRVRIISVDRENGRVGLSRKDTYSDPILEVVEGEDYDGVVENITEFGAFVRLPSGVVGLVHISEVSYARFEKVNDVLKTGMNVRAKVLSVNLRDRRVSLSIKQLEKDPWDGVHEKYAMGERLDVTVKELNNGGMVVQLDDSYEGFIPISEISHERIEHPSKVHSVGDVVKAQIINIDSQKRKIRLSVRQTLDRYADESVRDVRVTADDARPTAVGMTLGDVLAKSGFTASSVEEPETEKEVAEEKPEKKPKKTKASKESEKPVEQEEPATEEAATEEAATDATATEAAAEPTESDEESSDAPDETAQDEPEVQAGEQSVEDEAAVEPKTEDEKTAGEPADTDDASENKVSEPGDADVEPELVASDETEKPAIDEPAEEGDDGEERASD